MTFAEKVQRDTLDALTETLKEQHGYFDFANDDEERCIDELADLALKLGAMVGKVANELQSIPASLLITYLHNEMTWSALTHVDINKDFNKHTDLTEGEFDEDDDDDDDDFNAIITEITAEEARELIEKVLKELRDR